jgi:hypothetical protein
MKTKEQKIRAHFAVESLEHEDENGWWAYLRAGWIDGESLCHAIHEDTLADVSKKLRFVRREQAPPASALNKAGAAK